MAANTPNPTTPKGPDFSRATNKPRRRRDHSAEGRSEAAGATTKLPSSTPPQNPERYPNPLQVTVDLPDTLAAHLLAAGKDPARIALKALTLEALRELDIAAEPDIHEAIRQGRADVAAGRTSPAEEVCARLQTK